MALGPGKYDDLATMAGHGLRSVFERQVDHLAQVILRFLELPAFAHDMELASLARTSKSTRTDLTPN